MSLLPNPKSPRFPSALRNARVEAEMTHGELAEAAGISSVMPSRYERGITRPTMGTWQKLNRVLFEDVDEDEIEEEAKNEVIELSDASIEDISEELRSRGFQVALTYVGE